MYPDHSGAPNDFFPLGVGKNQREFSMDHVPVQGLIPGWLSGHYIRNGPGMYQLGNRRLNHWFDAMGALHRFSIIQGKVSYQCRYIQCGSYNHVAETGELKYSEFASDPCRSIFKKLHNYVIPTLPNMTDNPKINVARIGDKLMALGETPMQVEFDMQTLKAVGVQEMVPGEFAYKTTAHPHFDNESAYNLVVKFGMQSHYRIYDMGAEKRKAIASVPVAKPAYLHGFGMSRKYFIIAAGPLVVVPLQLLFWKRPYIENHKWLPGEGARIWVIDKESGKTKATFDQRFNTNGHYRFTYGVSIHPARREGFYNSIVKINAQTGESMYWHDDGSYPGEPCFVPAPNSRNDEDGVLLSIVLDAKKKNSYLLILDASNLQEIARATVCDAIVYGFHADFFT